MPVSILLVSVSVVFIMGLMNTTDDQTKWFSPGEKVRAVDTFGHDEVFTVRGTRMGKYAQGLVVDLADEAGGLLCLSVDEVQSASETR